MLINFSDEKLRAYALSSDYKDELVNNVIDRIRGDNEVMVEIKKICEEENADSVGGKLTIEDYINLKIDDIAQEGVERVKIYCDFDVEVEVK